MRNAMFGLLAVLLAGCIGGVREGGEAPASGANGADDGVFRVALLTPGPVSDSGWSAMAYEGLQAIERELGAETVNSEALDAQIRDAMRNYAQSGYDLVIGHGYEYNEPGVEVAADFPNTVFVSSSGAGTAANAGAIRFEMEQAFYLAGAMAGLLTETGTVAMVGGPDVPSIRSTFKAFRAGALATNPDVEVLEVFTGLNADIAAAKSATLTTIERGADYVIHQANAGAQGVFDACAQRGVKAFGANLNQNDNPSGVVLASAVIVAGPAFLDLARKVQAGEYEGTVSRYGMADGAIDFVLNMDLAAEIPENVRARLAEIRAGIEDGSIEVPMDEF